jgi:hypothetical protein
MRFVAPSISQHRLQRFHRWAMLWLDWFAAFLEAARAFAPLAPQTQRLAHAWLDPIERLVVGIVILRAAPHVRPLRVRRYGAEHGGAAGLHRAILGVSLRRRLRPKDLDRRIEALRQDIDALVAQLLKRLPRGLTRRRPIRPRPEMRAIALCAGCACAAPLCDSS